MSGNRERQLRRREFLTLLGGVAASTTLAPRATLAQTSNMPVIGYLAPESPDRFASRLNAFHKGLGETGYVEGRNVAIEYRWADSRQDRLPELAAELVRRKVTVIAAPGGAIGALAAKAATSTIPVVFETGADPVGIGLVTSLNRPEGNVTGVSSLNLEVGPKRFEILHELVPQAKVIAFIFDPTSRATADTAVQEAQKAADNLGLQLRVFHASTDRDLDEIFATFAQLHIGATVVSSNPFLANRPTQIAALTTRYAMPAIHQAREFAAVGGLASFGGSTAESHRQAGVYTGRILKGEKPADLPVQQVTKVELTINLRTAKALGLNVPLPLAGRADALIE
jgi:putative ABC transport system substrate-binding protein